MADAEAPVAAATGATKNKILFSFFWSIFSLVTTIQCDVDLFSAACGGDAGKTARSLAAVSGFMGVLGLFVNQIGGKLSDSIGRKPLFLLGPIVNTLCNFANFKVGSRSLPLLIATKTLRLTFNTFSGSTMSTAALMDITTPTEMAQMGARMQCSAGIAVILGPYAEVAIMNRIGGNVASRAFGVTSAMYLVQLVSQR